MVESDGGKAVGITASADGSVEFPPAAASGDVKPSNARALR